MPSASAHLAREIGGNLAKAIDVDVPVGTAYDRWTQFEEFSKFLVKVESITQSGEGGHTSVCG